MKLEGVKPDFLQRFRDSFAEIFITGAFPNSSKFKRIKFNSIDEVAEYFDIKLAQINSISLNYFDETEAVPFEIYFPYSENWDTYSEVNYAVTYHPLNNLEWNYGIFYDDMGNQMYELAEI